MRKTHRLALMMVVTILVITAFQVYWVQQNYLREKRSVQSKAEILFRESVYSLQGAKLNLDTLKLRDTVFETHTLTRAGQTALPKRQVINMVNIVGKQVDSLRQPAHKKMLVTVDKSSVFYRQDTNRQTTLDFHSTGDNQVVRFLYDIDSMQDSIKIRELDSAYATLLKAENMVIPFSVSKLNSPKKAIP